MTDSPFHLFQAFGVELEYMIVDAQTLGVCPIADKLLLDAAGSLQAEIEQGAISWSNELVLHVIELKTNGPAASLCALPDLFQQHVLRINELLAPLGARLMPTGMHPWMNPATELRLWPHEYNVIYQTYDRIFDCRGHGWANLQSSHLNLPFAGDEEFGRLHAAIRLLMPIMPALAASSPVVERRLTGLQDNRLELYRHNSRRVPSITGSVIPEPVFTAMDYRQQILQPMYDAIAPLDVEGVLQDEWLNARGAIARFDRSTIEIRVLSAQECPLADLAIIAAVSAVLEALCQQRWTDTRAQQATQTQPLVDIFLATVRDADAALIADRAYLARFGFDADHATASELWAHLIEDALPSGGPWSAPLQRILERGPLSRRIERALDNDVAGRLEPVYRELVDCLAEGRMF
jgi:gamma-glutamyl:cysteine ligase YbdK (ATP-grasp superfamily)